MAEDLKDLLARVEKAEGPDRELDGRIWCWLEGHTFLGVATADQCWADFGDNDAVSPRSKVGPGMMVFRHKAPGRRDAMLQGYGSYPRYTASLDAVLALVERVLPGWLWDVVGPGLYLHDNRPSARVYSPLHAQYEAKAKTPVLALLAALLKALIAQESP